MSRLKNRVASQLQIGDRIVWNYDNVTKVTDVSVDEKTTQITFIGSNGKTYTRRRQNTSLFKIM